MKTLCLIVAAATDCGVLAPKSVALPPVEGKVVSEPAMQWAAGEYKVLFRLGPKVFDEAGQRSFSHYQVTRKLAEYDYPITEAVESAYSNWAFGINDGVGKYLQLFTSPSGKTLLIAERVPNDCAPCMNWILVTGRNVSLVHEYLALPTRAVDPQEFYEEFPTITKVTEKEISLRYSDGHEQTVAVKDVAKQDKRPTFPG